ncbi:MAG TPA: hypothetical protein VMU14_21330 [Acidimicrobiales bacterium]|nr:hypothetical protein [Acidimicrobiales bacterium]
MAAAALACAACSKLPAGSSTATTVAPTTTVPGASTPAQTKAADYRARVTYLLVENLYLLSRATGDVVASPTAAASPPSAGGATSTTPTTSATPSTSTTSTTTGSGTAPTSTTASTTSTTTAGPAPAAAPAPVQTTDDSGKALDANTHDLGDLLAEPQGYSGTFSSDFYALWAQRSQYFASYAAAKATNNLAAAQRALTALAANATAVGTLFHVSNKYIAVNTVGGTGMADELTTDNATVTAFIDAQAAKGPLAVSDVVSSAEQFRHTATVMAAAAAKLDPDQYPGNATGTAANLRATQTAVLVDHVQIAGLAVDQLVKGAAGGPQLGALANNTTALTNVIIANYGDPPAKQFFSLWSSYVNGLAATARAKAGTGTAPDLSGVGAQIGAFYASLGPQLSASTIGADMQQMVDALVAYIDASASTAQPVTQLRVATATVPKLASDIAEGIAENKPTQYLP